MTVVRYSGIDGAVIVTTPQEVALLDVRKEITFCRKVGVPILGVVENMAAFACPKCQVSSLLMASAGDIFYTEPGMLIKWRELCWKNRMNTLSGPNMRLPAT